MSIDYATLPRTPSGALTAASKRAIEAERQANIRQHVIDVARRQAENEVLDRLIAASEQLDAEHGETAHCITGRDERIREAALEEGREQGADEAREYGEGIVYDMVREGIYRIETLGLDGELSALDVLKRMRDVIGE